MPLGDLQPEQQEAFLARLALVGIDLSDVVERVGPDTHPGQGILSEDAELSVIKPHMFQISDVDQMKNLAGNADQLYSAGLMAEHHTIPEPWPAEHAQLAATAMSAAQRNVIHHAHLVWLYGNSASVSTYRDVINKVEYPRSVPVFAAVNLEITAANSPFRISGDSGHIFGTVTIYAGGSIKFEGNIDFNVQKMVQSDLPGPASA